MPVNIAVNGLGRIGRCIVRAYKELPRSDVKIVAVNGPAPDETNAHLLKYDSVHGTFASEVKVENGYLIVGGEKIKLLAERDPKNIDWKKYGVDVVLECTGQFTKKDQAAIHIAQGAKKVIISAPSKDDVKTIVFSVNHKSLTPTDNIISIGSCTTNCLAPVVKILNETIGIELGHMTTIHAYTGDQNILDGNHKDLRRARAAGLSLVPTSTGAAESMGKIFPELIGKLSGTAVRVPVPNVSLVDFNCLTSRETTKEEINQVMKKAAAGALKNILEVNELPLVSRDFNHNPASSIFDATQTCVIGGKLVRIAAWYDNEWGFSVRMMDVAALLGDMLK